MPTKLCRDCKWVSNPGPFAVCEAPQNYKDTFSAQIAKRTGFEAPIEKERKGYWSCTIQRSENFLFCRLPPYTCGKEGRWFEPKQN